MKKIVLFFLLILSVFLPSCENNVIFNYNPENVKEARFIKIEKVDPQTGEINCDEDFSTNTYYLYFNVKGTYSSPITPEHPKLGDFAENTKLIFLKQNGEVEDKITANKLEFDSIGKTLSNRQNLHFFLDGTKDNGDDSSGISNTIFGYILSALSSYLSNESNNYDNSEITYPTLDYFGAKYTLFSAKSGLEDVTNHTVSKTKQYIRDITNMLSYLETGSTNDTSLSSQYNTFSDNKRYLFEAYNTVSQAMIDDTNNKNKNLFLFLVGYDYRYYDETLKASEEFQNLENEMFTKASQQDYPTFIVANRSDSRSFKEPYGSEIDKKLKKLTCLSNGAYFKEKANSSVLINFSESTNVINSVIGQVMYGYWRVKVTLDPSITGDYQGQLKFEYSGSGENQTVTVSYKIVR
ncbi:hypothetical protein JXR93_07620 [bacterium]|nr:hypothetical protein [bacterium]